MKVVRAAGAILGLGLALVLLTTSRPGAAGSPLPAAIRVSIAPRGELEVTPAPPRPLLVARSLVPGRRVAGSEFAVRNQTGNDLEIVLRAGADSSALDGLLRVRLGAAGKTLADTTLQGMRQRPVSLRLASGVRVELRIQAWIPSDVLSGYEGRMVHVSLVPEVRTIGGRS
jgi:hypothetical protein